MKNIEFISYIITTIVVFAISVFAHRRFNQGLSKSSKGQQTRRYLAAAIVSILPLAIAQVNVTSSAILFNAIVAIICGTTYPIIYHLSNHKQSPDYDNRYDIVFGIYLFGWLTALQITLAAIGGIVNTIGNIIIGIIVFAIMLLAVIQWGHYLIYNSCFDTNGMQAAQDTDHNEAIEFVKSFPVHTIAIIALSILLLCGICIGGKIVTEIGTHPSAISAAIAAIWAVAMFKYIWVGKRSLLYRTGFVTLYNDVKEYSRRNSLYTKEMNVRLSKLELELKNENKKPHTYIMVIGESASRDYMSAYDTTEHNTTPWQAQCKNDGEHNIFFTHAYACANQTVPTLERVLTERNQYNNKEFNESTSIIDIARKAGYKTHWYSNQGCIGVADTSITLVANTCDVAKWTKQEVNKVQYDGSLLEFLDEIDETQNNFVVFHLMGSHFNFINRYPKEATIWGKPGVQDNVLNYDNSLHYTDSILKSIYDYASKKLNLQALIYFSDHGCSPDKRRSPQFLGFEMLRIPLSIHCTEEYVSLHKKRIEAMKANKDKFFTNDLMYELICGILDIESNHFDKDNSLAHEEYKYTRDMLLTNNGTKKISDDTNI